MHHVFVLLGPVSKVNRQWHVPKSARSETVPLWSKQNQESPFLGPQSSKPQTSKLSPLTLKPSKLNPSVRKPENLRPQMSDPQTLL